MQMKTLLKWAVPVALLLFVLVPGITGFMVESKFDQQAERLQGLPLTSQITVDKTTIDRGWFGSDVDTELRIANPVLNAVISGMYGNESGEAPLFLVRTNASHGVLPLASPGKGGLRPAIAQGESEVFVRFGQGEEHKLPMKLYTSSGMSQWMKLVADPIDKMQVEDGAQISFSGAELAGSVSSESADISGFIGDISIDSPEFSVKVGRSKIDSEMDSGKYGMPEGKTRVSIPSLAMNSAEAGQSISVKDMEIYADLDVDGDRALMATRYSTGAIENPGMNVDGINLDMTYDLDAEAVANLQKLAKAAGAEPTPQEKEAMSAAMMSIMEKGGRIAVKSFDIDVGGSNAHFDLDLELPPGVNNPLMAIGSLKGAGELKIPESFVAKLQELSPEIGGGLAMASMTGFIKLENGNYQTTMKLENGALLLNDLPVPLPF